jgi:CheY-like chemotaxis protein
MSRVLVVDDWEDSISTLQLLLQSWGHETCAAADGATALTMAEKFLPDVVLLDIGLPGMDGNKVAKQLRQRDLQKPLIIAHSGYCTTEVVKLSLDAGCDLHLSKPVEPDEIKRILTDYEQRKPSA